MINSRRKGKAGELELAMWLREHGFEGKRGQQYSGANGDADVIGIPGVHIECKRVEQININKWLAQAEADAYADSLKQGKQIIPAVFHRQNKSRTKNDAVARVKGEWKVTLFAEDFIKLIRGNRDDRD